MLAARCVCALLCAEHTLMRQALSAVDDLLRGERWMQRGPELRRLGMLMGFLQAFERRCHEPKERDHLLPLLRDRSPQIDKAVKELEQAQSHDGQMLSHALELLGAVERGDAVAAGELKHVLLWHRVAKLARLAREEGTLFTLARQALSQDEWARIASSISNVPSTAEALREMDIELLAETLPALWGPSRKPEREVIGSSLGSFAGHRASPGFRLV